MAAFHGKRGTGTFTSLTFEFLSFTIDATADVVDTSKMDSSAVAAAKHWKDFVIGFKDWTASVEALLPAAGVGLAALGTSATLTLDTTEGLSYAGTAICTGISLASGVDAAGTTTLSFQGVAQLSGT